MSEQRPRLAGKRALVTGASGGIGAAVAKALAQEGADVAIHHLGDREGAQSVASAIEGHGRTACIAEADIQTVQACRALMAQAQAGLGGLDIVVNNAGITGWGPALSVEEEQWDGVMDTNLKGPYLLTQLVANHMVAEIGDRSTQIAGSPELPSPNSDFRSIINIGSISAYTASVNRGEYCLSKAGMGMMTALYAARLAEHGINVYEVRPGVIATDMTGAVKEKYDKLILEDERGIAPIRRWGKPEDIAKAVAAIARGTLPYSTGEVINVDGGFHLKTL